jgi:hypothetical protein
VVSGLMWGWFELFVGQGVNNLHIFAIEKKAQEKNVQPEMQC